MPITGITPQEEAVRIAGVVVRLNATALQSLLEDEPVDLVISSPRYLLRTTTAGRGVGRRGWQYLAVTRGVVFHAITKSPLSIPRTVNTIQAEDIWVSFLGPKRAV